MITLEAGEYVVPGDYTIDRLTPHMFVVRQRKRKATAIEKRCKDCAHYKRGKAFYNAYREDFICDLKPKRYGLYYVARPYEMACEHYEERKL